MEHVPALKKKLYEISRLRGCGLCQRYSRYGKKYVKVVRDFLLHTIDGRNPAPVDMVNIPLIFSQGFIHPRWLFGISSINSISTDLRLDG